MTNIRESVFLTPNSLPIKNRPATEPVTLKVHNVKLSFNIWLVLYIYFILYFWHFQNTKYHYQLHMICLVNSTAFCYWPLPSAILFIIPVVVATTRPVSNSSTSNKSQRRISSGEHELYNPQENLIGNYNSILPTIYINYL